MTEKQKEKIRDSMIKHWDSKRKPILNKNGYVTLTIGNKKQYVHRLVMEKHIGRKLLKTEQVHHINGDKTDNRIENLEIVFLGEHQRRHAIDSGLGKDSDDNSDNNSDDEENQDEDNSNEDEE